MVYMYCTNYFKLSIVLVQFLSLAVWLLFYVILSKIVDMSGNLHDWYPIGCLCNHVKSCVSENVGSFCMIYALLEATLCIFAGSSDWNKRSIGHFLLPWQTYQCISRCRLIRQKKRDLPETGFFFSLLCMIVSTMKCFDKADVWLHLLADGVISKHH